MLPHATRVMIGSLALAAVLAAGCGNANEAPAPAPPPAPSAAPVIQPLAIATLERGAYSGVTERKVLLITSQEEWLAHWQAHASRQIPVPPAPGFDFGKEAIVAAYMGEQNSGGYAVTITEVKQDDGRLLVTVKQTAPSPGVSVTMAMTQPYHMVRIPKVPAGTQVEVTWQ